MNRQHSVCTVDCRWPMCSVLPRLCWSCRRRRQRTLNVLFLH